MMECMGPAAPASGQIVLPYIRGDAAKPVSSIDTPGMQ